MFIKLFPLCLFVRTHLSNNRMYQKCRVNQRFLEFTLTILDVRSCITNNFIYTKVTQFLCYVFIQKSQPTLTKFRLKKVCIQGSNLRSIVSTGVRQTVIYAGETAAARLVIYNLLMLKQHCLKETITL